MGNVHEVARAVDPEAWVVYADIDPTAIVHARQILAGDTRTVFVQANLHDATEILGDPQVKALLDLSRPVCLIMVAILHFLPDTPELHAALRAYHEALAPGSVLVVSHATGDVDEVAELYTRTGTPMVLRDRDALAGLLEGWELVEPGLVHSPSWHPDPADELLADPASYAKLAGVAIRP
ncbi:SAM-dependent methyltransferase [Dactylosporangium sp. McL0621]|uniref:SAM-dependent methyltransferase n=1 Tax=Dactylosporangium sp. McL0621 TaxID=3415678 RepID=UPI003CE88378